MTREPSFRSIEVPPKMRLLDRDRRGYPVPWIVQRDLAGRPFFVMNDHDRVAACGRRKLCGICGRRLERDIWLIGGPGAAFHERGIFVDPPMHRACGTYALRVCPYIAARYTGRVDEALLKHGQWPPGLTVAVESAMPLGHPPFFVLARTAHAEVLPGPLFNFRPRRPWLAVEFWRLGAQITATEAAALLRAEGEWDLADLLHWPGSH